MKIFKFNELMVNTYNSYIDNILKDYDININKRDIPQF